MHLSEVRRLFAYWRRYPPLRDLVAGFVGFKPEPAPGGETPKEGGEMLVALFPDGQMRI